MKGNIIEDILPCVPSLLYFPLNMILNPNFYLLDSSTLPIISCQFYQLLFKNPKILSISTHAKCIMTLAMAL